MRKTIEKNIKKNIGDDIQENDEVPMEGSFNFQIQDGNVFECSYTTKKIKKVKPMTNFKWFLHTHSR